MTTNPVMPQGPTPLSIEMKAKVSCIDISTAQSDDQSAAVGYTTQTIRKHALRRK